MESLRYVRGLYYRLLIPFAVCLVFMVTGLSSPLNWILPLVFGGIWLQGFVSLSMRIRRQQRD